MLRTECVTTPVTFLNSLNSTNGLCFILCFRTYLSLSPLLVFFLSPYYTTCSLAFLLFPIIFITLRILIPISPFLLIPPPPVFFFIHTCITHLSLSIIFIPTVLSSYFSLALVPPIFLYRAIPP